MSEDTDIIWDINPFNISFYELKTVYVGVAIVQKMSIRTGSLEIETEQVFCIRTQLSA